jgi:hypothetical protein
MNRGAIEYLVALAIGLFSAAVPWLWPDRREFGYAMIVVAVLCCIFCFYGIAKLTRRWLVARTESLGPTKMMILVGIAATWLCGTVAAATFAWSLWNEPKGRMIGVALGSADSEAGPITWVQSFTSMEGGLSGLNVASLRFQGANTSKTTVRLKSASITSLIDGTQLPLEIVGNASDGTSKIVSLDKVGLIAPGAPIELVAKFGPPDPSRPGFVMGLPPNAFLEKWRQFAFDAADDHRSYHFEVNETAFMPFFKGKVGPRVSLNPDL